MTVGLVGYGMYIRSPSSQTHTTKPDSLPSYPTRQAKIGSEVFTVLLPQTEKEQQLGLSVVKKLPKNYSMLFPGKGVIGIWMKDMHYPIDIIWIDKSSKIIYIVHSAQPASYPKKTYYNPPFTYASAAIEVNDGEAKRLQLRVGDSIAFQ